MRNNASPFLKVSVEGRFASSPLDRLREAMSNPPRSEHQLPELRGNALSIRTNVTDLQEN